MSDVRVIKDGERKAIKNHVCDLWDDFNETCFPKNKLSFSELRQLIIYKNKQYKISKGDTYYWQFNESAGSCYTWKANKTIYDIMKKHDLLYFD